MSDFGEAKRFEFYVEPTTEEEAVRSCRRIAARLARKYADRFNPEDDLLQEGLIAALKAWRRFSPDKGVMFTTYAYSSIRGAIQHYLRDKGRLVRVPAYQQERGHPAVGVQLVGDWTTAESQHELFVQPTFPDRIVELLEDRRSL